MKPPKLQRWIDLLAALLARRYPATFEELIRDVPAYAAGDQSHETRRRMFERDKDELRAFGIPIETIAARRGRAPATSCAPATSTCRTSPLRAEGSATTAPQDRQVRLRLAPDAHLRGRGAGGGRRRRGAGPRARRPAPRRARRVGDAEAGVRPAGGRGARRRATGGPARARAAPELFAALGDALQRRKRVTFGYHTMGSDATRRARLTRSGSSSSTSTGTSPPATPGEETVKNYRLSRITDAKVNAGKPGTPDYDIPRRLRPPRACPLPPGLGARHGDAVTAVVASARLRRRRRRAPAR